MTLVEYVDMALADLPDSRLMKVGQVEDILLDIRRQAQQAEVAYD